METLDKSIFEANGAKLNYTEHYNGHSYENWKAHLGDTLQFLSRKEK